MSFHICLKQQFRLATIIWLICAFSLACPVVHAENLLQIYELALQNDLKLQEAEAYRNAILESRPQGIARLLPTLSAAGESSRNSVYSKFRERELGFIAGGRNIDFWNNSVSVTLTQPIYHRESWVQLAQADSEIAEAEAVFAAETQTLILRTAQAYFGVLQAQNTLAMHEAEESAILNQLKQAKARFEAGMIPSTDVQEAQASYDQTLANKIAAENTLESAKEALREIVGAYSGNLFDLVEDLPLASPQPETIDAWTKQALLNNLAILAAENNVEVSKHHIELKTAGHYPSIDLVGTAGIFDTDRAFGISSEYQSVGVQVKVPLFAGGSVESQTRQAEHRLEAAQKRLDFQRRSVSHLVKNAFLNVQTIIRQIQALDHSDSVLSKRL